MARRAWNMMGGIDWSGLPIVVERLGVTDVDMLIDQLVVIRDFYNAKR